MSEKTFEETVLEHFIERSINKANELSGLSFELTKMDFANALNMDDDVTYFVPLENGQSVGFFYLGISYEDLDDFYVRVIETLGVDLKIAERTLPKEQVVVEYGKDLHFVSIDKTDPYQKTKKFFNDDSVDTDFIKFEDEIKRDCLYFEIRDKKTNITLRFKTMFYLFDDSENMKINNEDSNEIHEERTFGFTEEELLSRISDEYSDFLKFFKREIKKVKELFKNGDEDYLVCYLKHGYLSTDVIDSFEKALFQLYYMFESDEAFDSTWIDKDRNQVYSFGLSDPYRYEEKEDDEMIEE